ncbi:MAG: hypothetical protein KUL80_07020 [Comamonas sp.]|nr:hypothetical protein [Comamonas sp.]
MAIGAASGLPCHTRAGRATTNGVPIDAPSMKGDSDLVELGLNVHPLKNKR